MLSLSKSLISYKTPLHKIDGREVGGKGWNLFRLLHFGFPVPGWCAVSTSIFNDLVGVLRESIKNILSQTDFTDQHALEHSSSQIRELVFSLIFPKQLRQEIITTLGEIIEKGARIAIRSSVVGEDSSENSFAGQMDSFLNVGPSEIERAIKKVWASAFSPKALVYRYRKNLSLTDISTAVIIQEMVQSVASGVLFTRNPENKKKQCLISAGFGLGEGVVNNKVEIDNYRISWKSEKILKDTQFKQVLSDKQIRQLRDIGIKAEKCFGYPQDIEWAYDVRGRIFILQARPIIFARRKDCSPSIRIWDNANIIENYPGLTLPLTFSFTRKCYGHSLRKAAFGFVLLKNELKKELPIFKNMIGLLDGRLYNNLLNWYQMLSYLPGFDAYKASWEQMNGVKEKIDFPQNKLSILNRFFTLLIAIWRLLTVRKNSRKFFTHFNSAYKIYRTYGISLASEEELIHLYQLLDRAFADKWPRTLYNDFCAVKYSDWLNQLCQKWDLDKYPNLLNNLLSVECDVESIAPVFSLVHIAGIIHKNPTYRALFSEEDDLTIWSKIKSDIAYTDLETLLEAHLEAYGDRGLEDLKLEEPSFREKPASLIGLIKNYFQLGLSVETIEKQEEHIRRNAEKVVRQCLRNPVKRLIFKFILRNARLSIANRENMRFARSRVYGIVKRLFRRMADLFVEKGLLESNADLYFLTVDEVFGFVQGTAVTKNLKALVKIRKAEYAEFAQRIPKERIQTKGIPYMNSFADAEPGNGKCNRLKGIGCSSGIAEGKVTVVFDPHNAIGNSNHILVARSTDPGWVFLMISSKGIVVEKGSVLSHTAIIGRELGIPTIVGVKDATRIIPDGAHMFINGSTGEIRWQ
jgi:pyruvate,water dikinase